jgi:hypothetical protein
MSDIENRKTQPFGCLRAIGDAQLLCDPCNFLQHTFTLDIYEHLRGQTRKIILVEAIQMSGGDLV